MMKIIRGRINADNFSSLNRQLFKDGCVATIGNFDGVHLAHQLLLKRAVDLAHDQKVLSVVITFEPHPGEFFNKNDCWPRLTNFHEKIAQFKKQHIDVVVVFNFSLDLSRLSAETFAKILKEELKIKHLIVGDDFHFGNNRQGHADDLKKTIDRVESFETQSINGKRISSSHIREALKNADFEMAKQMLGRNYSICGEVVHGDKRGRTIGFPTANIHLKNRKPPLKGVYVAQVLFKNKTYQGIANVGTRPSIKDKDIVHLEVHILDFDQEIYGEHLEVVFLKKIRDEKKFLSLNELKNQLEKDKNFV